MERRSSVRVDGLAATVQLSRAEFEHLKMILEHTSYKADKVTLVFKCFEGSDTLVIEGVEADGALLITPVYD